MGSNPYQCGSLIVYFCVYPNLMAILVGEIKADLGVVPVTLGSIVVGRECSTG